MTKILLWAFILVGVTIETFKLGHNLFYNDFILLFALYVLAFDAVVEYIVKKRRGVK